LFTKSFGVKSRFLIIGVALFLTLAANGAFFKHVTEVYPLSWDTVAFITSLALVLMSVTIILLSLFSFRYTIKPLLILILIFSSFFFSDTATTQIYTLHIVGSVRCV